MDAIDPTLDYPEPDDYEGGPPPGRGPVPGPPAAPQAARPAQPNGAALGAVIDYLSRIATALERIAGIQQLTNPAPPPPQAPPQYQQPPAPRAAGAVPWTLPAQQADPAAMAVLQQWVCPEHGTPPKMVPAGITKSGPRQGQPYTAFWVCSTPRCNHKPPQ